MDESDWVSVHAFYHGDLDHLVTEAVAPLVEELTDESVLRGWFFLRYWEGGPHLRLRLLPDRGQRATVEKRVGNRLLSYLHTHPSADRMGQDLYERMAHAHGRMERRDSYAERMYPNNTLSFIPYRREHARYGDGATIEAVERHFDESSRVALRLLTMGTSPDERATTACAAILLAWMACEPDPHRLSDLLGDIWSGGADSADLLGLDGGITAARTARRQERALELARQMRRLLTVMGDVPFSGTFVEWSRSMITLRDALVRATQDSSFVSPASERGGPHGSAPNLGVLPVMNLCAHLFCNRLGVLLDAEDAVRKAAAEAVEALAAEQATATNGTGGVHGMA